MEATLKYIQAIYNTLNKNKNKLNELDAAIGDGDYGSNISRGYHEILKVKSSFTPSSSLDADLMKCASVLMAKIGGSSGLLHGTAYMQLSIHLKGLKEIKNSDFAKALEAALNGIKTLGKSSEGEKTMIDALSPAVNAFKSASDDQPLVFAKARDAAQQGAKATKQMKATKGRASYLGDRSIGCMDAGACSIALIFDAVNNIYNSK